MKLIFALTLVSIFLSPIMGHSRTDSQEKFELVQEQPGASTKPKKSAGDKSKSPKEPKELPEIKNPTPNTPRQPKGSK